MTTILRRCAAASAALSTALLIGEARAAVVTTLADSGAGSLRDAVASASSGDTVSFAANLGGAIVLASPIVVNKDISIAGNGAIALDGNDAVTVLSIPFGAHVTLDGLTIRHGRGVLGGGIYSAGHVTIRRCFIRDNHATSAGGGLFVEALPGSGFTLTDSFVIDNEAAGPGGGIDDTGLQDSSIADSDITGNLALDTGGGVNLGSAKTLTVDHSTIAGNLAQNSTSRGGGLAALGGAAVAISYSTVAANKAHFGGGIHVNPAGTANITASLVSGNTAESDGGGIFVFGGALHTLNSTIAKNLAGVATGGGVCVQNSASGTASAVLLSSTVALNQSATYGGGIMLISGSLTLQYTLIGANTAPTNPDVQATLTSLGLNLVQNRGTSSGYVVSDLANGSNPMLDNLAFNGGPTDTINLLAGSAAIGAITGDKCQPIPLDQRGFRRLGTACDIGALETDGIGDTVFADGFEP